MLAWPVWLLCRQVVRGCQGIVRRDTAEFQLPLTLLRYTTCMTKVARSVVAAVLITAGLGLAGTGAATTAQAQLGPFPNFHCPGHPGWNFSRCVATHR